MEEEQLEKTNHAKTTATQTGPQKLTQQQSQELQRLLEQNPSPHTLMAMIWVVVGQPKQKAQEGKPQRQPGPRPPKPPEEQPKVPKHQAETLDDSLTQPGNFSPKTAKVINSSMNITAKTEDTGTTMTEHELKQQEPHRLSSLADLQPPQNIQEARRMTELGASFCLTTAQSGSLRIWPREENSLKAWLATAVLKMKTDDGQEKQSK